MELKTEKVEAYLAEGREKIIFLKKPLYIQKEDRFDPLIILFISTIEFMEIKHGDGLQYQNHLKENYGFEFKDAELRTQITNILLLTN